ncbi:hypothetical protein BH10CHL1_BH10CHL1_43480 [soil metagenome]
MTRWSDEKTDCRIFAGRLLWGCWLRAAIERGAT